MVTEMIVNVDLDSTVLQVIKKPGCAFDVGTGLGYEPTTYDVTVDDVVRHPDCSADSAIRALGHYIHSLSHKLSVLR